MRMPLDNFMYRKDDFINRAIWYVKFLWWPRRCWISGRWLWLTKAYKGTAMFTGPGEPVFEHHWIDKDQYLVAKIKGIL